MNIRKFIGTTSRDALRLVREALGADAVVLSNRALGDGSVEIVALADSELAAIAPAAGESAAAEGAARSNPPVMFCESVCERFARRVLVGVRCKRRSRRG